MNEDAPDSDSDPDQDATGGTTETPAQDFGMRLPTLDRRGRGGTAGVEHHELSSLANVEHKVSVTAIDYSPEQFQSRDVTDDLPGFLSRHRPPWTAVRWINIDGIQDESIIRGFAEKYELHPLAIADVIHTPQRPKVEDFPATHDHHPRLFVIARMISLDKGRLCCEQVSMFLGRNTLITFQESEGDVWDAVRGRIEKTGSRLRMNDASFLLYALLDAIIDQCFPILEYFSDSLEDLENEILLTPSRETIQTVHKVKRELLLLRRAAWPMREAIGMLQREPHECLSETTRTYLRDVYDRSVQIVELIETYREFAVSLNETYISTMSQRLNEVMKVLTIMGTIFIPLSFLAAVYGMNMPILEAQSPWMYPVFWGICGLIAVTLLVWFKRRDWI